VTGANQVREDRRNRHEEGICAAGRDGCRGCREFAAAGDLGALGELVGAAREGLLALSVGLGLSVVHELMELEVAAVVGPKGKHDPDRTAKRHGHEDGSMTLGGRRVQVSRPRMRTADDERELPVTTYEHFADRDPLTRAVMDRMLVGVSSRKFAAVGEPVGEEVQRSSTATSKMSVSEMFIERTRTALGELMGRRLEDVRVAVMMLDGLEIAVDSSNTNRPIYMPPSKRFLTVPRFSSEITTRTWPRRLKATDVEAMPRARAERFYERVLISMRGLTNGRFEARRAWAPQSFGSRLASIPKTLIYP
jgi:hypothetical protein